MDLDIEKALAGAAPAKSTRKCLIQRFLDQFPADKPGLEKLTLMLTVHDDRRDGYAPAPEGLRVLAELGVYTSERTPLEHRRSACRCYR